MSYTYAPARKAGGLAAGKTEMLNAFKFTQLPSKRAEECHHPIFRGAH